MLWCSACLNAQVLTRLNHAIHNNKHQIYNHTQSGIYTPCPNLNAFSIIEANCIRPHHRQCSGQQNSRQEAYRPAGGNHLQLLPRPTNRWGGPATDHQGTQGTSSHIWQPSDPPAVSIVVYFSPNQVSLSRWRPSAAEIIGFCVTFAGNAFIIL